MPEGDALYRAARRLQVLVGQTLEVETPNPRAAVKQLAPVLDGRRLESVEAVGKNLLLRFDGGLVLRSHLRMRGRWRVEAAGTKPAGRPWLVLRGRRRQAVLWNGPVLELTRGSSPAVARLGPDIMASPPDLIAVLRKQPVVGDKPATVMVVGHNPGLEELAELLVDDGDEAAHELMGEKFPTCALAVLQFDTESWSGIAPGTAKLARFLTPARLT